MSVQEGKSADDASSDEEDSDYCPQSDESDEESEEDWRSVGTPDHDEEPESKEKENFNAELFERNVSLWKRSLADAGGPPGEHRPPEEGGVAKKPKSDGRIPDAALAPEHSTSTVEKSAQSSDSPAGSAPARPKGGLSAGLALLDKKRKPTVLQASRMKWDSFKAEAGIEHELESHNRSKDSFLDKQEFLQRADYRQYEAMRSTLFGKKN